MPRYGASLISTVSTWIEVEADTAEEAEGLIYNKAPGGLCHQCAREMDGPDDWDISDGGVQEL